MNSKLKATLITFALVIAAIVSGLLLLPRQAQAAAIGGGEQYKVINILRFEAADLEEELNRLGAAGWKVRTGAAAALILAK